jgi:lysophospholipase L1-like esterase
MKKSMRIALTAAGLGMGASMAVHSQTARPLSSTRAGGSSAIDPQWRDSFDAFALADKATPPQPGGVLFVGSSSIRLWNDLEEQFETQPLVIKRGFGGSRMSDVARYVPQLVLPYEPSTVVVYAGDNDLAEGGTPEGVLKSFRQFVAEVHAALPATRIAYISIKPSPLRAALMDSARKTNQLVEQYVATDKSLDYIDVYSKMIGSDERPRSELFLADMLHLNPAGYAIWKKEITAHLRRTQAAPLAAAR